MLGGRGLLVRGSLIKTLLCKILVFFTFQIFNIVFVGGRYLAGNIIFQFLLVISCLVFFISSNLFISSHLLSLQIIIFLPIFINSVIFKPGTFWTPYNVLWWLLSSTKNNVQVWGKGVGSKGTLTTLVGREGSLPYKKGSFQNWHGTGLVVRSCPCKQKSPIKAFKF